MIKQRVENYELQKMSSNKPNDRKKVNDQGYFVNNTTGKAIFRRDSPAGKIFSRNLYIIV
jgi:hypothetical protein